MKHLRTALAAGVALWALPVHAQWQVPANSIPYGLGPGVVGFGSAAGINGQCLTIVGTTPTFGSCGSITPPLVISPPVGTSTQGIVINQTSGATTAPGEIRFNEINVTSNVNPSPPGSTMLPFGDNVASGLKITFSEGASAGGFQVGLQLRHNMNVANAIGADHVSFAIQTNVNANLSGRGVYGSNPAIYAQTGSDVSHLVASNPQIQSDTGITSLQHRVGVRSQSASAAAPGTKGSAIDAAYTVVSSGNNSWKDALVLGEANEFSLFPPLHTSGSIIRAHVPMTITNFFDLSNVVASSHFLKFDNKVTWTGDGQLNITRNAATNGGLTVQNNDSTNVASFLAINDVGLTGGLAEFGIRGSTKVAYGALVARDAYVYGSGSTGVTVMADNATGVIKFAPGGNAEKVRISTDGTVVASKNATAVPSLPAFIGSPGLEVVGVDAAAVSSATLAFGAGATNYPTIIGLRARGIGAAPAAVQSGDVLASFGGGGYGTSLSNVRSGMTAFANQTWTGSANGSWLQFFTTPDGSVTPAESARILANSNWAIGGVVASDSTSISKLTVKTSANGATVLAANTSSLGAASGGLFSARAEGTPSAIDQRIGGFYGSAVTTGTTGFHSAGVAMYSTQAWSSTAAGTYIAFQNTADSTVTLAEKMRLTSSGTLVVSGLPSGAPTAGTLLLINANAAAPRSASTEAGTIIHAVNADSTTTRILMDAYGSTSQHGGLVTRHARGTAATPTATQSADLLGSYFARGYGATNYNSNAGAGFILIALENYTDSAAAAGVDMYTTATGSASAGHAARFHPSKGFSVGTTSDPGLGMIYTNSASFMMRTKTSYTNGAGAGGGTLTNAPAAGNPTKWIPVDDNGTTRYVPAW